MKKAATGGTFAVIHKGHEALFDRSSKASSLVTVGVTTSGLSPKSHLIPPFEVRSRQILRYFESHYGFRPIIAPLTDHYGPVVNDPEYRTLVTSEENLPFACQIRMLRYKKGYPSLSIAVVHTVRAGDGRPISSTRILNEEVDVTGRVLCEIEKDLPW